MEFILFQILIRDNYERVDGTGFMNMYVEGRLQLNFHTGTDSQTLVIRLLEQHKHIHDHDRVKTIEMNLIKSIVDVKNDNRSLHIYAYENNKVFKSFHLQIFFSSIERCTAFKRKMSKYRRETSHMEIEKKFNFKFECNEHGRIELGRGAYGIVYLAKDLYTMKKFAIKEVRIGKADDINAIQTKIKNISTLNRKNIVKYEGTSIIRDRKPTKPSSMPIGTPQYISPDMVNISPTGYGSEVDIWSIRCTVLEMVTGEKPYHEITNPLAILYKIGIEKQPPHIAETLSENIKSFLNKCFSSTREYPSAKDLLNHSFIK
ncbi:unnamed protein product [Rotaria sordida]|uniref:Protein kinase domain-containing protein n=1 Tax=Rotaria sordida TaxID=392033 RepID=A0A815F4L2_9BILA|nr:unnamed protein product [Rotaria sordida]